MSRRGKKSEQTVKIGKAARTAKRECGGFQERASFELLEGLRSRSGRAVQASACSVHKARAVRFEGEL